MLLSISRRFLRGDSTKFSTNTGLYTRPNPERGAADKRQVACDRLQLAAGEMGLRKRAPQSDRYAGAGHVGRQVTPQRSETRAACVAVDWGLLSTYAGG